MTKPLENNPEQLSEAIATAMRRAGSQTSRPGIDEEELLLFAAGRLDRVPIDRRGPLLQAVATDPQLGQLVAELQALGLDEGRAGSGQEADGPAVLARIGPRVGAPLGMAWLAAACLLLGVGLWRVNDPPAPLNPDGSVSMMSIPDQTPQDRDYWQQLDEQRRMQRVERDQYRDYALVATATATLVLSIPIVWLALRPRRRRV